MENFCSLVSFCEDLLTTEHILSSYILLNFLDGTSYTNKNATIYCTWDKVLFGLARKKIIAEYFVSPHYEREREGQSGGQLEDLAFCNVGLLKGVTLIKIKISSSIPPIITGQLIRKIIGVLA